MSLRITSSIQAPQTGINGVPAAPTVGQWSISTAGILSFSALPDLNGASWLDIWQYDLDGAENWAPVPGWTNGSDALRDFDISAALTDGVEYDVRVRAVNAAGASLASDTKTITYSTGTYVSPTLASASLTKIGSNGYSAQVTTNKSGTLHVLVSTNTSELEATILSEPGNAVSDGPQSVGGAGLAEGTYYAHFAFTDGTNTVTARSGAITVTAPGSGSGTVTGSIVGGHTTLIAPAYVHFGIAVSGASVSEPVGDKAFDPTYSDIIYETTFGDPGSASPVVENLPLEHNNQNIQGGKYPAHVFLEPGTYTVTHRAYESDGTLIGEDTQTVVVQDPDTVFAGSRTILVDPDGVGDNATYPSSQVFTNFNTAWNAARTIGLAGNTCRILLRRGTTTVLNSQYVMRSNDFKNFYLGDWGSGTTNPIIQLATSNSVGNGNHLFYAQGSFNGDVVLKNINGLGLWDSINRTGMNARFFSWDLTNVGTKQVLVTGGFYSGWYTSLEPRGGDTLPHSFCAHNVYSTNWADYGLGFLVGERAHMALIGNKLAQDPLAHMNYTHADSKAGFNDVRHGPARVAQGGAVVISGNDSFSRNGWSPAFGAISAHQPNYRIITSANDYAVRQKVTIERNAMEGGGAVLQLSNQNDRSVFFSPMVLIEKNLIVGTCATYEPLVLDFSGITLRNNIIVQPNVLYWGVPFREFMRYAFDPGDQASNAQEQGFPVRIHHNTFISFLDDTNRSGSGMGLTGNSFPNNFTDRIIENNVLWSPNASVTNDEAANLSTDPMQTVQGDWSPRFLGTIQEGVDTYGVPNTTYATPSGSVPTARPNVGSPVIGSSTGSTQVRDNYYGELRIGAQNRGAV
jgi:hypothetical protein